MPMGRLRHARIVGLSGGPGLGQAFRFILSLTTIGRCHINIGSCFVLDESKLSVFCIEKVFLSILVFFHFLLRAHHNVVIILHLAKAGKDRYTDVTVTFDAVNCKSLRHL